jgi:uncharacterized protein with HEPN domain
MSTRVIMWHHHAEHILKCIDKIERFRAKYEKSDREVYEDALYRNLHTISESCDKLPKHLKDAYPDIPWSKVKGFRNLVVHNYLGDDIDQRIVNDIVYHSLPALRNTVEHMLKRYPDSEQ